MVCNNMIVLWNQVVLDWLRENERSQAWLARKAGVSAVHLCRCLNVSNNPSDRLLYRLEKVMGVEADSLVTLKNGVSLESIA